MRQKITKNSLATLAGAGKFEKVFRVAEATTGEKSLLTSGASLINFAPSKLESEMPS
jgi:hypothetical protein